jgi:hypothetical protein
MVTTDHNKSVAVETGEIKKKKSFGKMFLSFLMYGGWLLVIVLVVGIIIAVQILTK